MHMAMACEEDFTKVATVNVTKVNQLLKSRWWDPLMKYFSPTKYIYETIVLHHDFAGGSDCEGRRLWTCNGVIDEANIVIVPVDKGSLRVEICR